MPDTDRPHVDIVDSTWFAARPAVVGIAIADAANWPRWWPGLELTVEEYRKEKGVRWFVRAVRPDHGARLSGSAEVWLEPMSEGVVAHFFLRLDAAPGARFDHHERERITREYRVATKKAFWALADGLDPGRMDRHTSASHASVT